MNLIIILTILSVILLSTVVFLNIRLILEYRKILMKEVINLKLQVGFLYCGLQILRNCTLSKIDQKIFDCAVPGKSFGHIALDIEEFKEGLIRYLEAARSKILKEKKENPGSQNVKVREKQLEKMTGIFNLLMVIDEKSPTEYTKTVIHDIMASLEELYSLESEIQ